MAGTEPPTAIPLQSELVFTVNDSSSPFFLTSGDNPGNVLVSQLLIGAENFNTWYRSMVVALRAKNKLGFVTGSLSEPLITDNLHEKWVRCDSMIISWILNSVSKDIASSIIYGNTFKEVWDDIRERNSQKNGPRVFQLKKAISLLKQEHMSVTVYFAKMKSLWDELSNYNVLPVCNCGALRTCTCNIIKSLLEVQEKEHIMCFLMGLNDCYTQVRDQILLMEPLPSMNTVFAKITQQERQREITGLGTAVKEPNYESMAMLSRFGDQRHHGNKSHIRKIGHFVPIAICLDM